MVQTHLITCTDINGKPHQVPINQLTYRIQTYGILIKKNQILLSPQFEDGYDFPGGGVKIYENLEQGLIREFKEETGLDIKPLRLLHHAEDFFITPYTNKAHHTILFFYLCKYIKGQISTEGFDKYEKLSIKKAQWVDIKQISKLKFYNPINSPKIIHQAHQLVASA